MEGEIEQSSGARRMSKPKQTSPCENVRYIETPVGLRKLTEGIMDKDFSGFGDERGSTRRLINVERYTKEVMSSLMDKQDRQTNNRKHGAEIKISRM